MLIYSLKRLGVAILVALFVSAAAFVTLRLSGDPAIAIAGEGARAADIELVRQTYGLDRPLVVQYFDWLETVMRGDFGQSLYFKTERGIADRRQAADDIHRRRVGDPARAGAVDSARRAGGGLPTAGSTVSRSPSRSPARRCRTSSSR